jgi:hypothetical protein
VSCSAHALALLFKDVTDPKEKRLPWM